MYVVSTPNCLHRSSARWVRSTWTPSWRSSVSTPVALSTSAPSVAGGTRRFTTYVSCELAVRAEQRPAEFGRYELLITCDDEQWVRSIVTDVARMSMETTFDDGHTLDIGPCVEPSDVLQGVIFEKRAQSTIEGESYGVPGLVGVTTAELDFAIAHGSASILRRLTEAGIYPNTTASHCLWSRRVTCSRSLCAACSSSPSPASECCDARPCGW